MALVPFSVSADVSDLSDGIFEFLGTVAFEDGRLEIRYHGETHGSAPKKHTRHTVELEDIAGVGFRRGWFGGARLTLNAGHIDAFDGIPFAREGNLELAIARKHRQAAVDLMAAVQTRLDFPKLPRR